MTPKVHFKLQSLILLTLIPSLLLVTVVVGALIYRTLQAVILQGFDRKLSAISSVMGAFIDGDEHAKILRVKDEKSPLYRKYVVAMQHIRSRRGLTFIYTQFLGDGGNILYVLDGQIGANHSAIGDKDTLPEGEVSGAHEVITAAKVHLSDIRVWEQWGLLKSGFAPIYDHSGNVVAMAGADVNISTIRQKTGVALAQVGVTSVIALLIAGFLSMAIARGLTRPIAQVKEAALQVAAGQYGHRIEVERPRELAELAGSFNAMSQTLAATVQEWTAVHRDLEQRRRRHELQRALEGRAGGAGNANGAKGAGSQAGCRLSAIRLSVGEPGQPTADSRQRTADSPDSRVQRGIAASSGSVVSDDRSRVLVWLSDPNGEPMETARCHAEIAVIGKRLLERYRDNPEPLVTRLQHLFEDAVSCFVLLDTRAGCLRAITRRSTPATVMGDSPTAVREIDLLTTPSLSLSPDERLQLGPAGFGIGATGAGWEGRDGDRPAPKGDAWLAGMGQGKRP